MSWTSFFRSFRPSTEEVPLSMSARLATLESELLSVRATQDHTLTICRKLQGKVYRGVSLGDTVDAEPQQEGPPQPDVSIGFTPEKQELYERAARLRGR